ncbi:MAG: hypothetical protein NTX06_01675 [Proteobacteria bacterium]|nr:hypothetical protein [Pseudomonadota bacterium]
MADRNECSGKKFQTRSIPLIPLVALACMLLLPACKSPPPDYDLYENMGAYMKGKLVDAGATVRTDMPALFAPGTEYIKRLNPLLRLVFGSGKLQVFLQSYESDRIAVGSISQFEVPPESGNYTDCAFVVRPTAKIGAPIMHGDARAAMSGSDEEFSMDFYNYDNASVDVDKFFGNAQIAKLNEAMALVAQYQIPELDEKGERDRGHLTAYLDPYKSPYRLELAAPETESEREAYANAALQAFQLYQDAYFAALDNATQNDDGDIVEGRATATASFMALFESEDIAVKIGRLLFGKKDFPLYFNQGFWRTGWYGYGSDNATK